MFAMFGATVLVPILTGLDPAIAILSAGLGTLVFTYVLGMVPVFLGFQFCFYTCYSTCSQEEGLAAVKGGVIVAGLIYAIMAGSH